MDVAEEEGLWFHVDGALGALGVQSPRLRPPLAGLERADSLIFDLHRMAQPQGLRVGEVRPAHRTERHAGPARLHEAGIAVPSYTTLQGRYCLRVCINNHRTRTAVLDTFVSEVLRIGREIASGR